MFPSSYFTLIGIILVWSNCSSLIPYELINIVLYWSIWFFHAATLYQGISSTLSAIAINFQSRRFTIPLGVIAIRSIVPALFDLGSNICISERNTVPLSNDFNLFKRFSLRVSYISLSGSLGSIWGTYPESSNISSTALNNPFSSTRTPPLPSLSPLTKYSKSACPFVPFSILRSSTALASSVLRISPPLNLLLYQSLISSDTLLAICVTPSKKYLSSFSPLTSTSFFVSLVSISLILSIASSCLLFCKNTLPSSALISSTVPISFPEIMSIAALSKPLFINNPLNHSTIEDQKDCVLARSSGFSVLPSFWLMIVSTNIFAIASSLSFKMSGLPSLPW